MNALPRELSQRSIAAGALLAAALWLAGCASQPLRTPPPTTPSPVPGTPSSPLPPPPADVSAIPDAVPRVEARSPYGNPASYDVAGTRYVILGAAEGYRERGVASWYGPNFHGKRTSSGEPYDMYAMTAAHKTLPIPCYARVTNLGNQRSVVVRINDRGPFVDNRLIDLSYTAAAKLGLIGAGTAFVEVEVLTPGATATAATTTAATTAAAPPLAATATPGAIPTTSPALAPAPGTPEHGLYVQVGAYGDAANADRISAKLRAAGLQPLLSTTRAGGGDLLRRVRVGPVADVGAFDALIRKLEALGIRGARLALDSLIDSSSRQD